MELDWSTFILEIVNFLILAWLLSRFFFKPVARIIDRRRDEIRKNMEAAEAARNEADMLRKQYESRLIEWEDEKSDARRKLHDEIEKERRRLLEELRDELEQERNKEALLNRRRRETEKQVNERLALKQGAAFSARLLSRLASPALETSIIKYTLDEMAALTPEQKESLKSGQDITRTGVSIHSAYPLDAATRDQIENSIRDITGTSGRCVFHQDPALIAGLRIAIGSRLLEATIRDELKYFSGDNHVPG